MGKKNLVFSEEEPDPENCDMICPAIWTPLCGSDGKTYSNDCVFNMEKCLQKGNLEIAHQGKCPEPEPEPVLPISDKKCDWMCDKSYKPVCSDGKIYSNFCMFKKEKCLEGNKVTGFGFFQILKNYEKGECQSNDVIDPPILVIDPVPG